MPDLSGIAVIVPSLHPERDLLIPFVTAVQALGPDVVVVVDDGSGSSHASVFEEARAAGCTVLRHPQNRGKGRAIKTALTHVVDHHPGVVGVVTADSDGQHAPEDVLVVATETRAAAGPGGAHPVLVLGCRSFDGPGIPPRSRFGNTATSTTVKVLFGRYFSDTQTGLRGISTGLVPGITAVRGERFEFEMRSLLWATSGTTEIREVPISTIYHDVTNSVSHFRPVTDSLIIYRIIAAQFLRFTAASSASAALDLLTYLVLIDVVFGSDRTTTHVALSVVIARLVSALVNFQLNRRVVFGTAVGRSRALARYAALAALVLLGSTIGTTALSVASGGHDVWAKVITDLVLFYLSFVAQKQWVFREDRAERKQVRRDAAGVGPGGTRR